MKREQERKEHSAQTGDNPKEEKEHSAQTEDNPKEREITLRRRERISLGRERTMRRVVPLSHPGIYHHGTHPGIHLPTHPGTHHLRAYREVYTTYGHTGRYI